MMARLRARRYRFRVQQFEASSTKPRRAKLIASRRIFSNGKTVSAGVDVTKDKLKAMVSKAKPKLRGGRIRG